MDARKQPARTTTTHSSAPQRTRSLEDLCRAVIVANLEKYDPMCLGSLCEDDWEHIVRVRHQKTQPLQRKTNAGLDGSGRVAPAISDKVLTLIEETNPHLADSAVVDELVWRDCVEYRFRRGNTLTRPRELYLPWPELLAHVRQLAQGLQSGNEDSVVDAMVDLPMNVALLQATGIGKVVRKSIKKQKQQPSGGICEDGASKLEALLQSWKALAAQKAPTPPQTDLEMAERCSSWRQLFAALKQRQESRRESQGKRMREIRQHLASGRPKVVKVRPAIPNKRLARTVAGERAMGGSSNAKLSQIRREAASQRQQQKPAPRRATTAKRPNNASFGDAVAFVSGKKKGTTTVGMKLLPGGKLMTMPAAKKSGRLGNKKFKFSR